MLRPARNSVMAYSYAVWSYGPVGDRIPRLDGQDARALLGGRNKTFNAQVL